MSLISLHGGEKKECMSLISLHGGEKGVHEPDQFSRWLKKSA